MSKINQIQNKLLELEGGTFQKLADAYLHKKGYEQINPLGSLIGVNKVRKGTPDTLIPLNNGKYVFAEHTTQQKDIYKKLEGDLNKCFDENKTGLSVHKIEGLVFCHTSTLSVEQENSLAKKCQNHKVNLSIFGIGPISFDLYQKYPGLARDFLGVEVDTGQIVSSADFVTLYNKNRLATRLDTSFHFRKEDVSRVLQGIEEENLIIVSGRAGVGKSRLALECCEQYRMLHPETKVRCIFNRGPDLFEDLRVHFSEPGSFLIFVDDANRISGFDYVVQLLRDQRENQEIKIIATVRDYALNKVREIVGFYRNAVEVELQYLEEKQIKQLVKDECDIHNHLYLDRIATISQGNPRLAMMAAEVAKRENTLQSIDNVSAIYDEYYTSIRRDIEKLDEQEFLQAAGIVAFFQAVDRSNKEVMDTIQEVLGISCDEFWKAAQGLHELEILDMYEDEVVRMSDQVLATYLFYLAFFKARKLDFSALLNYFFPHLRHRFVDAIYPVINAFDREAIIKEMRPHIDNIWNSKNGTGHDEYLLHLMEVFWFLKQTDTLLYVQNRISKMELKTIELSDIDFKEDSHIPSPSLLNILGSFKNSDQDTFRMALDLIFGYLFKCPDDLPNVLYLLVKRFGFRHTSYLRGFMVQGTVIDVLWEYAKDKDELFTRLFLSVAEKYLDTYFHITELKGEHALTIINFELPSHPELFKLRRTILKCLFQIYNTPTLQKPVLKLLYNYSMGRHPSSVNEVLTEDAEEIIPFINSKLDAQKYYHCLVVHVYLDFLENREISFDKGLRNRFINETYSVSRLLLTDFSERRHLGVSYEAYRQFMKERIRKFFGDYALTDYAQLFKQCFEIQAELDGNHELGQLSGGIADVLIVLADRDPELYTKVLEQYLTLGDPFRFYFVYLIVEKLLQIVGSEKAYKILSEPTYPTKQHWLFGYYQSISTDEVTYENLDQLYTLYRKAEPGEIPYDFDFLLKYCSLQEDVVVQIAQIILEKTKLDSSYAFALSGLFNPHTSVNKEIANHFADSLDTLKQAYLMTLTIGRAVDYDGQTFTRILDLDPNFGLEYIDQIYETGDMQPRNYDTHDYTFIWMRDNYEEMMTQIVQSIYDHEQKEGFWWDTMLNGFLADKKNNKNNSEVKDRQDHFLKELIKKKYNDSNFMGFIFEFIASFVPERRQKFVALFLTYNKNFEDFKRISLEPHVRSWSGSAVPMHQARVEYYESLLPLMNTVDLLHHKQNIERRIQAIRQEIEWEKKRDFVER